MLLGDLDLANSNIVEQGLDAILAHFQLPVFPRTISTHATRNAQILVFDKRSVLKHFSTASYLDCRINAYPYGISFKGIDRIPSSFFMCDLDLKDFDNNIKRLDKALEATIATLQVKMEGHPTIL